MKHIVVCLDGTWKRPETPDGKQRASNVLRLMRALSPSADGVHQVVYYDRGVGSDNACDKLVGGAFGWGLSENVLDAYRWLANNYDEGDRLYFFGFSRGAYTARSLGGLLGAIGMMSRLEIGALPEAYDYYRTECCGRPAGAHRPGCARAAHAHAATAEARAKPPVACIGVWDTVGSLGIPVSWLPSFNRKYQFHDVKIGRHVEAAFQALAIDEARKPFTPAIWEKPSGWAGRLEQAWFAGVHSDVGGGYADNRLADIALRWMVEKAQSVGLRFDDVVLEAGVDPRPSPHLGAMGDEFKGMYRFTGRQYREVYSDPARGVSLDGRIAEDPARGLTIHESVRLRQREETLEPRYAPPNL